MKNLHKILFILLHDVVIDVDQSEITFFSESLLGNHPDSFLSFDYARLYRIIKKDDNTFQIHNFEDLKKKLHEQCLQSIIKQLNDDYKNGVIKVNNEDKYIKSHDNAENGQNISVYVKIIDFPISEPLYSKLNTYDFEKKKKIYFCESELAELFNFHVFSFINQNFIQNFMKIFFENLWIENFDLKNFYHHFEKLNHFIYEQNKEQIFLQDITNTDNISKHLATWAKKKENTTQLLTQFEQIFYNFLYIFYDTYFLEVINANKEKYFDAFFNKSAKKVYIIHETSFLKSQKFYTFETLIVNLNNEFFWSQIANLVEIFNSLSLNTIYIYVRCFKRIFGSK